ERVVDADLDRLLAGDVGHRAAPEIVGHPGVVVGADHRTGPEPATTVLEARDASALLDDADRAGVRTAGEAFEQRWIVAPAFGAVQHHRFEQHLAGDRGGPLPVKQTLGRRASIVAGFWRQNAVVRDLADVERTVAAALLIPGRRELVPR